MKTNRILLTVTYTNGNTLRSLVHGVRVDTEAGMLSYIEDAQVHYSVVHFPTNIPFAAISGFEIAPCECEGWTPTEDVKLGLTLAQGKAE